MVRIETKDVEEASFLWVQEAIDFEKVETRERGTRGVTIFFVFSSKLKPEEISLIRKDYYNRNSLVEPKDFARAGVDVRNILHEALRQKK